MKSVFSFWEVFLYMSWIHAYQSSPSAGLTNGTKISEGDNSAPLVLTLNASNNEISQSQKLSLRCDTGYQTQGSTIISITGNTTKWALSLDNITWQAYGASLTIPTVINNTNTIFYARAKSSSDESPANDISSKINVSSTIVAV